MYARYHFMWEGDRSKGRESASQWRRTGGTGGAGRVKVGQSGMCGRGGMVGNLTVVLMWRW